MSVDVTITRNEVAVTTTPSVVTATVTPTQITLSPIVGISDHAALANLTTGDPHTQYLLETGGTLGSGDAQSIYVATTAQLLRAVKGTSASPNTTLGPIVKAERLINIAESAITGDGSEECAAIVGVGVATAACETQPVGVFGGAKTSSTAGAPGNDAVGVYGVGRALTGATGVGFGGFFQGRRDDTTGYACGVEVLCSNFTATAGTYNATGFSSLSGITLNANGNANCGVAIQVRPAGQQWVTGIGFVKESSVSAVTTASISDDSDAATSIAINGAHATAAIRVAAGSGPVLIGGTSQFVAGTLLEVQAPDAATNPLVIFGATAYNRPYTVRLRNSSAQHLWFITSTANQFLTGTAIGDSGFSAVDTGKSVHLGGSTSVLQVKADNTLGFFQHATAAQQTGGANVTNNVTSGGTSDTIDNWTNLSTYSTDAAAIRNAVYQLARLVKQDHDALRAYGLLT